MSVNALETKYEKCGFIDCYSRYTTESFGEDSLILKKTCILPKRLFFM